MYFVILDSNVWVAERMLQSALGSAVLYSLTKTGSRIGLPEIVQLEVDRILLEQTDKAAEMIKKSSLLLQQISGHRMAITAPSQTAITKGIARRWNELSAVLKRIDFTLDHARGALSRIIEKTPPCGSNNEQFRDCCIWQCALDLALDAPVHLISNDHAFYEGGSRIGGLSRILEAEAHRLNRKVALHSNLSAFLYAAHGAESAFDDAKVRAAIVTAVTPRVREIAADASKGGSFALGEVRQAKIVGYATPKPSVVAVSFSIDFTLTRVEIGEGGEKQSEARMSIGGECSHDPHTNAISDVEISRWSKDLDGKGGGFWGTSFDARMNEQYSEGNIRFL